MLPVLALWAGSRFVIAHSHASIRTAGCAAADHVVDVATLGALTIGKPLAVVAISSARRDRIVGLRELVAEDDVDRPSGPITATLRRGTRMKSRGTCLGS